MESLIIIREPAVWSYVLTWSWTRLVGPLRYNYPSGMEHGYEKHQTLVCPNEIAP